MVSAGRGLGWPCSWLGRWWRWRDPRHEPQRVEDLLLWLLACVGGNYRADDVSVTVDEVQQRHQDEWGRAEQARRWLNRGPPQSRDQWRQAVVSHLLQQVHAVKPVPFTQDGVTKNRDVGDESGRQRAAWLLPEVAAVHLPLGVHGRAAWRVGTG
jgi:hypothetical protein